MASKKAAETSVPITPPIACMDSSWVLKVAAANATNIEASTTTVECPREK